MSDWRIQRQCPSKDAGKSNVMTGIELACMLSEDLSHVTSCYLVCKDPWHPPDAPNSLRGCCSTLLSKGAKGSTRMVALHCSYSWWEVFSYHKSSNHSSLCLPHMWKPFIVTMYWLFFFFFRGGMDRSNRVVYWSGMCFIWRMRGSPVLPEPGALPTDFGHKRPIDLTILDHKRW